MLERVAECLAVTEALITSTGERRMIRNLVLDAQTAEPAVCQVNVDLAAASPQAPTAERFSASGVTEYRRALRLDVGRPDPERSLSGSYDCTAILSHSAHRSGDNLKVRLARS